MKLQLIWIPFKGCPYIDKPHYDLCTIEKSSYNIACIATDKKGAKIIRRLLKEWNIRK